MERIVLYVLNRIVYRVSEMERPEIPFLCHGQRDFAKILWKEGQAAGFYSVKTKGLVIIIIINVISNAPFIRKQISRCYS